MRLWSVHPQYLDARGIVAAWREGLLALAVLEGRTRGYRHHPQLDRFRAARDPVRALRVYLRALWRESVVRGYHFDAAKAPPARHGTLTVTAGQLAWEWRHLLAKLRLRDPARYRSLVRLGTVVPHPLFRRVPGPAAPWEKGTGNARRKQP
jgi:hypothetical protein